jgi:hypothetical protein
MTASLNNYQFSFGEQLTATVTAASGSGTVVTYTATNTFTAGAIVSITGLGVGSGSSLNLTFVRVASATLSSFTVNDATVGVSSGTGTATTGFLFGGAGSPYQILEIDGLEALPDLRTQDDNRGYNDGMFSGRDFLSGRSIVITVNTFGGNGRTAHQNFNLFQNALIPQQTGTTVVQFLLSANDTVARLNARVRTRRTNITPEYTFGYIQSQITLFAPDPRYYADATAGTTSGLQTYTLTATTPQGRIYNRVYNLVYGTGSLASSTAVTNTGWATTNPIITIAGPITNPTVGNITTNQSMTFLTTLSSTDSLVIDLDQKLVTVNGIAARNLVAGGSTWFALAPGTSNLYFTGTGTQVGLTQATVVFRSAYI